MSLREVIATALESADPVTTTLKTLRKAAEAKLNRKVSESEKELIKELATKWMESQEASSSEDGAATDSSDEEEAAARPKKRQRKAPGQAPARKKQPAPLTAEEKALKALRALARAMGLGPAVHKNNPSASELADRLREKGATFKGVVPSDADIKAAQAATDLKRDLDGIDTSLIIEGGRGGRSRRSAAPVNLAEKSDVEESDEEEAEFDEEGDDNSEDSAHDEEEDSSDDDGVQLGVVVAKAAAKAKGKPKVQPPKAKAAVATGSTGGGGSRLKRSAPSADESEEEAEFEF